MNMTSQVLMVPVKKEKSFQYTREVVCVVGLKKFNYFEEAETIFVYIIHIYNIAWFAECQVVEY